METKHTPGPWTLRPRSDWSAPIVQRGKEGGFVVQGLSPEVEDADARLIAAAPELLEVATDARDALAAAIRAAWEGGDADVSEHIVIKKIDAAIAKATGAEA